MIDKISNTIVNDKVKSVYGFNDYSIQDLLSKFFEQINSVTDLVNQNEEKINTQNFKLEEFINYIKSEGIPPIVIETVTTMYNDGRLTELFNSLANNVIDKVEDFKTQVNSSLEHKANELEVVKKGQGTLNDFDEETRAKLLGLAEGETNINAVLGKENVKNENLAPNSVDVDKTTFFKLSKNLINEDTIIKGYQISTINGSIEINSNYNCTDFIELESGADYIFSNGLTNICRNIVNYDTNKNFISYGENIGVIKQSGNIKYVRLTLFNSATYNQFEKGTNVTEYHRYDYVYNKIPVPVDNLIGNIKVDKVDFIKLSKNLINEDTIKRGYQISTADGSEAYNSNYNCTDFIEVEPSTNYIFSNGLDNRIRHRVHYDVNKNFISYTENVNGYYSTNTNIKYVRFTLYKDVPYNQFEKGTKATEYIPYNSSKLGFYISEKNIEGKISKSKIKNYSKLTGKKIAFVGDSISDENSSLMWAVKKMYYRIIEENTGCEIYMHGVGGTGFNVRHSGVEDSINDRIKDIPTDSDYIVVFAGTNDWGIDNGTVLGKFEDYINNGNDVYYSLYSAIGNTIDKLKSKFPTGKICFITPLPRWDTGSPHDKNSRGFTLRDVSKAIIELCEWNSIPVLDLNAKSNIYDGDTYFVDKLHPKENGNRDILAPKIESFLETL